MWVTIMLIQFYKKWKTTQFIERFNPIKHIKASEKIAVSGAGSDVSGSNMSAENPSLTVSSL